MENFISAPKFNMISSIDSPTSIEFMSLALCVLACCRTSLTLLKLSGTAGAAGLLWDGLKAKKRV